MQMIQPRPSWRVPTEWFQPVLESCGPTSDGGPDRPIATSRQLRRRPIRIDFGFFSTVGPPAFDAALSANIFDMYEPNRVKSLRAVEQLIEETFAYPFDKLATYRAVYALATITMFGSTEHDGHFHWCVEVLRRPEGIGALTRAPRPSTCVTPGLRLRPTVR
jgi:hypothetical protein